MPHTQAVTLAKMGEAERSWRRNDGIDLLRALSILFVLMNHVNMQLLFAKVPYTKGYPAQLVYSLVWNGQFGVQIFFVVSGFLITSTSIRRWGTPDRLSARGFYLLRFARIAPLLLCLLCVLSVLHFARLSGFVIDGQTGGIGRAWLAALTFHINWLEATRGYLPGNWDILWSLSVEEMFYLFFPVAARLLPNRKLLLILLGIFIVAGPFARAKAFNTNPVWREYSYLGGMDGIALGCLTAMLLAGRQLKRPWVSGAIGAVLMISILCFSLKAYSWGLGRNGLDMSILAVGTALVIAAATQSTWQASPIFRPVLELGRRSYEIYLTHMFVILGVFAVFTRIGKPLHGVPILFALTIAFAGILGWLVAISFAEPINRLLRKRFSIRRSSLGSAMSEID